MRKSGLERDKRKPYAKPRIERVALVAEEAVLASCKIGTAIGYGASLDSCLTGQFCQTTGVS